MERDVLRTKQPEGKPITSDQKSFIHDIDIWFEDLFPRMDQERQALHTVQLKPGGVFNLEQEPRRE